MTYWPPPSQPWPRPATHTLGFQVNSVTVWFFTDLHDQRGLVAWNSLQHGGHSFHPQPPAQDLLSHSRTHLSWSCVCAPLWCNALISKEKDLEWEPYSLSYGEPQMT